MTLSNGRFLCVTQTCLGLISLPLDTPERTVLQNAVDAAVELTDSQIGYIHYVNPDQNSIELCTWSASTAQYCTAQFDRHYPLSRAGIWADTARLGFPQIHNDYAAAPNRRGLPSGHAPLTRHLGVPATTPDGIHLLMGVGNAARPYDEDDVAVTQHIADAAWLAVSRLRECGSLRTRLHLLEHSQGLVRQATWEWDPFTGTVLWDADMERLLPGFHTHVQTWQPLLDLLEPHSREEVQRILQQGAVEPLALQVRADVGTEPVTLLMQGYWADRPQGRDRVLRGTLVDVSMLTELDRAHDQATHDAMTGLPNRAWLLEELTSRLAALDRRAEDRLAVHFIDFDNFKDVNDRFGHVRGDEVLIECAHRLQRLTRRAERVARYGGDEFVLVQNGPVTSATASAMGARIRAGIAAEPIKVNGVDVCVSVSVGVAVCTVAGLSVESVLERADSALYAAKRAATGVVVTTV
jgi:diguanylate cyclase (GGDEF)-like protein